MKITFPIEFLVRGTPVSFQSGSPVSKGSWKQRVKLASNSALPALPTASNEPMSVTLYYLPDEPMAGDVDNIIKLTLDALNNHVYEDDNQVERVTVQKFEPGNVFQFSNPSLTMLDALTSATPVLYVRVSNDPHEDLR